MTSINIIGSAFGHGAQIYTTNLSPDFIRNYHNNFDNAQWGEIVNTSPLELRDHRGRNFESVYSHNSTLFNVVQKTCDKNFFPIVLGGDHSCGIGTWSAITDYYDCFESFGLVWVDAHMDAHTLESSESKAYHGMPVSILLGQGDTILHQIGAKLQKIKPEHLVLIGIRSYESAEHNLLASLGVKIFYMDDVKNKGMESVFKETLAIVTNNTKGFGVSIDLDAFDPTQAPGVGTPAPGGLDFESTYKHLSILLNAPTLKALELTEFNPTLDIDNKTADLVVRLIEKQSQRFSHK